MERVDHPLASALGRLGQDGSSGSISTHKPSSTIHERASPPPNDQIVTAVTLDRDASARSLCGLEQSCVVVRFAHPVSWATVR